MQVRRLRAGIRPTIACDVRHGKNFLLGF